LASLIPPLLFSSIYPDQTLNLRSSSIYRVLRLFAECLPLEIHFCQSVVCLLLCISSGVFIQVADTDSAFHETLRKFNLLIQTVQPAKEANKRAKQQTQAHEFSACSGLSIRARMSSTRQAVIFGPNLTGCGNRFVLTPAHHVLFDTGIGPWGAMMFFSRTNPVSGKNFVVGNFDCVM
jgi:hypothetical protein